MSTFLSQITTTRGKVNTELDSITLVDNSEVPLRSILRRTILCLGTIMVLAASAPGQALQMTGALSRELQGTQASAVVLDLNSSGVLAKIGQDRRGTPGSAIKPLLLEYALQHSIVREDTGVYCRRNLHVGNRALPCTHPADNPVFTAQSALAESCNTWFAEMARRYTGPALEAALRGYQLPHDDMSQANVQQRQLAVLGVQGVTVSLMELGQAYLKMLRRVPSDGAVARGLQDSVSFGMAHPAAVKGLIILGKTGTASDPGDAWTHGWFVGAIPGRFLIVVYVPHGDGGTAAQLAQRFFRDIAKEQTP
jgi:membrane peptidoglycan carboxypeptidase